MSHAVLGGQVAAVSPLPHKCMIRQAGSAPRASRPQRACVARTLAQQSSSKYAAPPPRTSHSGSSSVASYLQSLYTRSQEPQQLEQAQPGHSQSPAARQTGRQRNGSSPPDELVAAPVPPMSLQEAKNPGSVPFEAMYTQLARWRKVHASCHVPRNAYNAPPLLGAWVRHMRRLQRAGSLPKWQQDRLNLLGFEWRLDEATEKWISMYHEARRFQALHGHLNLPPAASEGRLGRGPLTRLARWLDAQGEAFAASKLTEPQLAMLRALRVQLRIPRSTVEQQVQLQGLNAFERKNLRRKWKLRAAAPHALRLRSSFYGSRKP